MSLIAVEEHILPVQVREAWAAAPPPHHPVSALADGGENGAKLADLGEGRLALMDEQGVDVQVLSLTTPGLHNLESGPALHTAHLVNDLVAQACARRSERFQGPRRPAHVRPAGGAARAGAGRPRARPQGRASLRPHARAPSRPP